MFYKQIRAVWSYVDSTFYLGVVTVLTALLLVVLGKGYCEDRNWLVRYQSGKGEK